MQLIDTHTHIYLPEFDTDRDEAVSNAVNNGVAYLLMPNIDGNSVAPMISAYSRYSGICYPMIGLHPTSVREDYLSQLEELEKLIDNHQFVAVGETGIDLYWDKTFIDQQIDSFRRQVILSIQMDVPVVIHSRESFAQIFSVLEEFKDKKLKGVFHAFTGDLDIAMKAISMGFSLGVGGIVTFKNSGLDKVIKQIDPQNIVIETDSPYLAPTPYRGKRNESSWLTIINRKLSEIYGMSVEEMASVTTANARELFNLK